MENIKLIWEFYGSDSYLTAKHHKTHLIEFCSNNNVQYTDADVEVYDENLTLSFLVVSKELALKLRDTLKPKRAEIYK